MYACLSPSKLLSSYCYRNLKYKIFFCFLSSFQIVHLVSLTSHKNHLLHQLTLDIQDLLFQAIQAQGFLQKAARTSPGAMVWVVCYWSDGVLGRLFWELGNVLTFHSSTLWRLVLYVLILIRFYPLSVFALFYRYGSWSLQMLSVWLNSCRLVWIWVLGLLLLCVVH